MASASDVPNRYDVVINSEGYICADLQDLKAEFGYTPTFIGRQNVQGDYGDNQQDFWLSQSQKDWSLGEQQRYFHSSGDDSKRRYWRGVGVDVQSPGSVKMRPGTSAVTLSGNAAAVSAIPLGRAGAQKILVATTTNLYTITDGLSITDEGAHTLGVAPSRWGLCSDTQVVYVSSAAAGTAGIRRYTSAGAWATFSAVGCYSICFLNNSLYGITGDVSGTVGTLSRFDTAGTATTLFTWKDALGNVLGIAPSSKVIPYGGKLAIIRVPAPNGVEIPAGTELWVYDGTAPAIAWQLPTGFVNWDACVSLGTIFISGTIPYQGSRVPVIYYYSNGTTGTLWRGDSAGGTRGPALTPWGNGLLFNDPALGTLLYYDATTGGVQTVTDSWATSSSLMTATAATVFVAQSGSTAAMGFQADGSTRSSSTIQTSLFDFDSSLTKTFRGVRVEFDSASDGNGGTVDISYRTGDVDGSYTSLQTGATSGTEYTLSGVTGRSISIKVTLNKGTSTNGPVLKRVSVRALPQQTTFNKRTYVLGLFGRNEVDPEEGQMMHRRDGTRHHKDGVQMRDDLVTAATSASPISITDEIGTYTGVIDLDNFKLQRMRRGEYLAIVPVRGV